MIESTHPITFISYSRRQLYFAESLVLHLQKENHNIWFDLQQLHAGSVWSDQLKDGVKKAKTLILIVSKASLASEYVEVEWKGVAAEGGQLVLAIFESVELPEELFGLPTFDFRTDFDENISALSSYLKGEGEPQFDKISSYNPFSWFGRKSSSILKIMMAQFGIPILLILIFVLYEGFNSSPEIDTVFRDRFMVLAGLSLLMSFGYAIPFLRHKLSYKKIKRSVLYSILLLLPFFFIIVNSVESDDIPRAIFFSMPGIFLSILVFNLYVYLIVLRKSMSFLRWMQPEDSLQKLRRRVHQPLIPKEVFDIDMESNANANANAKSVLYSIHHDAADKPLAKWITKYFKKVGHQKVAITKDPEHHIAILSNRSSIAWVNKITQSYAGKLIFVVVSTIEFSDSLKDTGRYQWVDAREMEKRDIIGLAKSLGDKAAWKREAALETTPDKIDTLKMPSGIKLFRSLLVIFGIYVLIFGVGNLMPGEKMDGVIIDKSYNSYLIFVGLLCMWIAAKGLIQRKIPSLIIYGITLLNFILVCYFGDIMLYFNQWGLLVITIPLLILSAIDGRYWLATFAKTNSDEVGMNKKIVQSYWKRRIIVITIWIVLFSGLAYWASNFPNK
ncbi:MAG: toll/interleukin-1 receptor domain-containing protein [Saprospiraceae bacterium]